MVLTAAGWPTGTCAGVEMNIGLFAKHDVFGKISML